MPEAGERDISACALTTTPLIGLVLLAVILVGLSLVFFVNPLARRLPEPGRPAAKRTPGCALGSLAGALPAFTSVAAIPANTTGGNFKGDAVTIGQPLRLTSSLTIVAERDLTVSANIDVPVQIQVAQVDVTLVSRQGNVFVAAGAKIGGGRAGPGDLDVAQQGGPRLLARGGAGRNGGFIRIVAPRGSIDIHGEIVGTSGGDGGEARARGVLAVLSNGDAVSVAGGCGGFGGDVVLCAADVIHVAGRIDGSDGGEGGRARANAGPGVDADAVGGDGGRAGDIVFRDNCQVYIDQGAAVRGGTAPYDNRGGLAEALAGNGDARVRGRGGDARAVGGKGGDGGTITFANCVVRNNGRVRSADGGVGGGFNGPPAVRAEGGNGLTANPRGFAGGSASAVGGMGGRAGAQPVFRIPTDVPGQRSGRGIKGEEAPGGDARARGGDGGNGQAPGSGAKSGEARARGGAKGGGAAPPAQSAAAEPPARATADGGDGPTVLSPGAT